MYPSQNHPALLPLPHPQRHFLPAGEGNSTPLARLRERGWGRGCARALLPILACLASSALAADGAIYRAPVSQGSALAQNLPQILLGLLLIGGLLVALLWLLKKAQRGSAAGGLIQIVASCPLSTRERLLLVAVGDEQVLLAASPAGIQPLHVLAQPMPLPAENTTSAGAFAAQLAALMPSLQRGRA